MSDENSNDSQTTAAPDGVQAESSVDVREEAPREQFQRVSVTRHWRQRFIGSDGSYIYRKPLNIRGTDGKMRRVRPGEPVDVDADGLVARRLKALWYAEAIELADPTQQNRRRKVTVQNNRAIREKAAAEELRDKTDQETYRRQRRRQREREREEEQQRQLADRAVFAAEERERAAMIDAEREEQRAQAAAAIQEELEEQQLLEEIEREELAEKQAQEAEEKAALEKERAALQLIRDEEQRLLQIERNLQKQARAAEREAELQATHRSDEERQALAEERGGAVKNQNNKAISAQEARAAFGKRPGDAE